jgi:hypothetical protein
MRSFKKREVLVNKYYAWEWPVGKTHPRRYEEPVLYSFYAAQARNAWVERGGTDPKRYHYRVKAYVKDLLKEEMRNALPTT